MELFVIDGFIVRPSMHALLIEPFKSIWEKDDTETKEIAIKIFSYTEMMCSPKKSNPFRNEPLDTRSESVKIEVFGENYKDVITSDMEMMMINSVEKYKDLLSKASPIYSLLITSMKAIQKTRDFLENIDYNKRTNSGSLVLKPKEVMTAIQEIPETEKVISELFAKVGQDLEEQSRTRNEREIGDYER